MPSRWAAPPSRAPRCSVQADIRAAESVLAALQPSAALAASRVRFDQLVALAFAGRHAARPPSPLSISPAIHLLPPPSITPLYHPALSPRSITPLYHLATALGSVAAHPRRLTAPAAPRVAPSAREQSPRGGHKLCPAHRGARLGLSAAADAAGPRPTSPRPTGCPDDVCRPPRDVAPARRRRRQRRGAHPPALAAAAEDGRADPTRPRGHPTARLPLCRGIASHRHPTPPCRLPPA